MTKKFASILVLCLSLACGVFSTPKPTATPTPLPTLTPTPLPTNTSIPVLGVSKVDVPDGGFSLFVPQFLEFDVDENTVGIFSEVLIVSFTGTVYDSSTSSLEDVIDDFLTELSTDGSELIKDGASSPIFVDDAEGIAFDLTGNLLGAPIEGQAIAVSPKEDFIVFGLAVSNLTSDDGLWKESASTLFQSMLDSMTFIEIPIANQSSNTGACEISTDSTYGYSESNPIKVGGDFLEGPARERAYLDNLLGPNGESLSYERQGSTQTDTTILDIYIITGSGIHETLYLDEYNYSELQAPVGFTCKGVFPLSAP